MGFVVRKPRTGEITATSANQMVAWNSLEVQKCCAIFTRSPFPFTGLKGGLDLKLNPYLLKMNFNVAVAWELHALFSFLFMCSCNNSCLLFFFSLLMVLKRHRQYMTN